MTKQAGEIGQCPPVFMEVRIVLQQRAGQADVEGKAQAAFVVPLTFLRMDKLADAVFGLAVEMVALFLETERFEQGMQIFDDLGESLCGVGALHISSPMMMRIKGTAAFRWPAIGDEF